MTDKSLPLAAAIFVTALLSFPAVHAQSAPAGPAGQSAKPSPYQGVSTPPASDVITTSEDSVAQPSAASEPAPASRTVPAAGPAAKSAPPAAKLGAVDTVDADQDQTAPPSAATSIRSSNNPDGRDPDAGIVTYVPGPANALPEGTVFRARMLQDVRAEDTNPGAPFRAKLSQDLVHQGHIVVPMGSELRGTITYISYGRRIGGRSVIHLRPDAFVLPDGARYPLHAEVIDTRGSDTTATGEGNISAAMHGKRTALELAASTGGGAVVGAAVAGPTGAIVGSVIGAGAMGAHLLLDDQSVTLPEGSTVVFSLTEPMFLTPAQQIEHSPVAMSR